MRLRVLGVAVLAAAVLFGMFPHTAMAATFGAEVTFPAEAPEPIWDTSFEGPFGDIVFEGNGTACDGYAASTAWHRTGSQSAGMAGSVSGPCLIDPAVAAPVVGKSYTFTWYQLDSGGSGQPWIGLGFCGSNYAVTSGASQVYGPGTEDTWVGPKTYTGTAPSGALYFCLVSEQQGNGFIDDLSITGDIQGGSCQGVGSLAWGASGLTTTHPWYGDGGRYTWLEPAGWGDFWFADMGSSAAINSACQHLFGQASFYYDFPGGEVTVGDTFAFGFAFWCVEDNEPCGIKFYWVNDAGARIMAAEEDSPTLCVGSDAVCQYTGQIWGTWATGNGTGNGEGPMGASGFNDALQEDIYGIEIEVSRGTYIGWLAIGNVEGTDGDPDDPDFDCPADTYCNKGSPSTFEDCTAPADPLDVPGWLEFLVCVVQNGFDAVMLAIGALVQAIMVRIENTLTALFVPTEIGDDWEAFRILVQGKAPIGWIVEVVGFLEDVLTAGNLSGPAVPATINVMGATVSVDLSSVFTPLSSYRFVFAGLVYIAGAWAIFRAVGRALGMGGDD